MMMMMMKEEEDEEEETVAQVRERSEFCSFAHLGNALENSSAGANFVAASSLTGRKKLALAQTASS